VGPTSKGRPGDGPPFFVRPILFGPFCLGSDPAAAAATLKLDVDGAECLAGAAAAALPDLEAALAGIAPRSGGARLHGIPALTSLLLHGAAISAAAADRLGARARPVRAILFDKTPGANWSLGWHQDRTIAVARRIEAPGFGPWTVKQGLPHVAPPFALLETMVTLRIHIDPVPETNAPLLVARGSHRAGLVREADIDRIVAECGTAACLAEAGDIWIYATPILHASEAARAPARRRVLQVDYAACDLPGALDWLGI